MQFISPPTFSVKRSSVTNRHSNTTTKQGAGYEAGFLRFILLVKYFTNSMAVTLAIVTSPIINMILPFNDVALKMVFEKGT